MRTFDNGYSEQFALYGPLVTADQPVHGEMKPVWAYTSLNKGLATSLVVQPKCTHGADVLLVLFQFPAAGNFEPQIVEALIAYRRHSDGS